MLGLLFLGLCVFTGLQFVHLFLSRLVFLCGRTSWTGRPVEAQNWLVTLPAAFVTGVLLLTWSVYLLSYLFSKTTQPLFFGNVLTVLLALLFIRWAWQKRNLSFNSYFQAIKGFSLQSTVAFCKQQPRDVIYTAVALGVSLFLMYFTLYAGNGRIFMGGWTYADISHHISVMRSFSVGHNFPTQFPYFSGDGIHYHFMFDFFAANLEYLGLRVDHAFNLAAALALTSMLMLLYVLGLLLTGSRVAAAMAMVLLFFRSSLAIYIYLKNALFTYLHVGVPSLHEILEKTVFIKIWVGRTMYEGWGQWSMPHEFVNQRHNALSMALMLLVLIAVWPLFESMQHQLAQLRRQGVKGLAALKAWFDTCFLKRDAWLPTHLAGYGAVGLLMGLSCFWNGPVLISTILVISTLALVSRHRLGIVLAVAVAVGLAYAQSHFFSWGDSNGSFNPKFHLGFEAPKGDLQTITAYYVEVFGVLPFLLLLGGFYLPKGGKWLVLAFLMPTIAATLFQFGTEIMLNQKFVFVTILLTTVVAAFGVTSLWRCKWKKALAVLLFVLLINTGIIDAFSFINKNARRLVFDDQSVVKTWVLQHTHPGAVFISNRDIISSMLLAGRKLFLGFDWYAKISGHDLDGRLALYRKIYGGDDPAEVKALLKSHGINYIYIDDGTRLKDDLTLNEPLFAEHFPRVFQDGGIAIYAVDGSSSGLGGDN